MTTNKDSIVRQLNLYLDKDNILRCRGRIENAKLERKTKFPVLLPTKNALTQLIVRDAHINHFHGGVNTTVTLLRQQYWIPRIRQCVKTIIRRCVICRKTTGRAYQKPNPPPLPNDRLHENLPFSVTGVDFAGPLYVKNFENVKIKVYICLFTCATTRAVHLELVENLSEKSFLLAFRRFSSRKSLPRTMISDNATTFSSSSKEIEMLTNSNTLKEKLNIHGTTWKFIPRGAPWYGGWWERLIGLTKSCLRKALGTACISTEQLRTILTEIEAILNDRPITYVHSDVNEPEPLTPSHLLYGHRITCLPYPTDHCTSTNIVPTTFRSLNEQYKLQNDILSHFRNRWKTEYLTSLREYHTAHGNNIQKIKVGDIVQIYEDAPRMKWKLGIVDKLLPGKDGLVRAVNLCTKTGFTNRPITKLYPIEISEMSSDNRL